MTIKVSLLSFGVGGIVIVIVVGVGVGVATGVVGGEVLVSSTSAVNASSERNARVKGVGRKKVDILKNSSFEKMEPTLSFCWVELVCIFLPLSDS